MSLLPPGPGSATDPAPASPPSIGPPHLRAALNAAAAYTAAENPAAASPTGHGPPAHTRPKGWYFYPPRDFYWVVGAAFVLCLVAHGVQYLGQRRALKRGRAVYTAHPQAAAGTESWAGAEVGARRGQREAVRAGKRREEEEGEGLLAGAEAEAEAGAGAASDPAPRASVARRGGLGLGLTEKGARGAPARGRVGQGAGAGVWKQWTVELSNWLYLAIFPKWMYAPETGMDALWTGVYCAGMAFCCVYDTPSIPNKCGCMAYAQTPVVFLLAVKNNPLQPLLGITYQKLNYLHRASARACIFASWVHTILWVGPLWVNSSMLRFYVIMGYTALIGFTGLWFLSVRAVRRGAYELFLVAHIVLSLAFIIGGCLHWPLRSHWIWPSFLVWAADRLVRVGKRMLGEYRHTSPGRGDGACRIEIVGRDVMRVTAPRTGLKWEAGQHFFITSSAIKSLPHESHPFSIANIPSLAASASASTSSRAKTQPEPEPETDAVFLIRAHSGFTRALQDILPSSDTHDVPLHLEGPYGHCHPLDAYESVLLVAGGTGVTFCLSYLLALLRPFAMQSSSGSFAGKATGGDSRRNVRSLVRRVRLVWHVRHVEDVQWIAPLINEAVGELDRELLEGGEEVGASQGVSRPGAGKVDVGGATDGLRVDVDVYVTRTKRSAEPWVETATVPPTPMENVSVAGTGTATPVNAAEAQRAAHAQGLDLAWRLGQVGKGQTLGQQGGWSSRSGAAVKLVRKNRGGSSSASGSSGQGQGQGQGGGGGPAKYDGSSVEGVTSPQKRGRFLMKELDQGMGRVMDGGATGAGGRNGLSRGMAMPLQVEVRETTRLLVGSAGLSGGSSGSGGSSYSAAANTSASASASATAAAMPSPRRGKSQVRFEDAAMATASPLPRPCAVDATEGVDRVGASVISGNARDAAAADADANDDTFRPGGRAAMDDLGLTRRARAHVSVHSGRAELGEIVRRMADGYVVDECEFCVGSGSAPGVGGGLGGGRGGVGGGVGSLAGARGTPLGEMIVVTCGPVPLMHDARRAVWGANSRKRVGAGRRVVQLLEETVGH